MSIDKSIQDAIVKETIKHIDIAAMAKQMAPSIAKEIKAGILYSLRENFDWNDFVYNELVSEKFGEYLANEIINVFKDKKKSAKQ